jgi:SAM-dependent methyltransferase
VDEPFDVISYFDGFGVGDDADQRRLLRRIAEWLKPNGCALIEVYTPWYWAPLDGKTMEWPNAMRRCVFDAAACRVLDTWWPTGNPEMAVTQTLRCYSPADLRLLLEPTGLELTDVESGGSYDLETEVYTPTVPLHQALQYLAVLRPISGGPKRG